MFASNFPVDGIGGSYGELLHVFDEVLRDASSEQLQKLSASNAERIYRL
jgi:L-fuconolactonase